MTRRLQDWIAQRAGQQPDAIALVMQDTRLTYADVEDASNRLSRALVQAGCRKGDRICLLVPKSVDAIVAIHAILKAGCISVPMDVRSPAIRLAKMTEACSPRLILASAATADLLGTLRSQSRQAQRARFGFLDSDPSGAMRSEAAFQSEDIARESSESHDLGVEDSEPAYILFTSGSTGVPKGVVVTHANIIGFVDWALHHFELAPSDRISQHPPLHFDLSIFDIFAACAAGAELHLVPPMMNVQADKLAKLIRDSELTQWFSVPSVLSYLAKFDVVSQGDFPKLKRVLWCGEVLPTPTLIHFMRRLPHAQFTNLYGPTEATIASSYYTVPNCPEDPRAAVPIGRPCDGEELLVLDGELEKAAPGETGDLYIGGVGLSPGYWRDRQATEASFLDSPSVLARYGRIYKTGDLARVGDDGLIYFHGRSDSQIKSRGYRIELGEIELALESTGKLSTCAVVAIDAGGFEGKKICCAYEPKNGTPVTAQILRNALAKKLPSYMVPTLWKEYAAMPKNANGKVDRQRLRQDAKGWASRQSTAAGVAVANAGAPWGLTAAARTGPET